MAAGQFPDHRPRANCPICGWNEWRHLPFPVGQVDTPVAAIATYPDIMHPLPALPLYCTRCGFVRLHVKPPK